MKPCPYCAEDIQEQAIKCRHCGELLGERQPEPPSGPVEALIPTANPSALIAYYLGCFSLIPFVGLLLGPAALVLGLVGRKKIAQDPRLPGTAHAWVGIVVGLVVTLGHLALIALIIARGR